MRAPLLSLLLCVGPSVWAVEKPIRITFPNAKSHVAAGSSVPVSIHGNTVTLQSAYAHLMGSTVHSPAVSSAPYTVQVDIPKTASGDVTIEAVATDASGHEYRAVVSVIVDPPEVAALPTAVEVLPSQIYFAGPGPSRTSIFARACYRSGVKHDISHAKDTQYTSNNPAVATVDVDGRVQGVHPGECMVSVRYGSLSQLVRVRVGDHQDPPEVAQSATPKP